MSDADSRRATILVGTYNRLDLLRRCVESVLAYDPARYALIVADAGSTDGTVEYLKSQPGLRFVRDPGKIGQARSLNQMAALADTDYVCWISDDNVLRPGALDLAVEILDRHASIGMIGLKVRDVSGPHSGKSFIGGVATTGLLNVNQGMLRTALLRKVGGFDETLRDYFIDVDLTTKVLLSGSEVVYTKAVGIDHYRDHETPSWIEPAARAQRLTANRAFYFLRYRGLSEASSASHLSGAFTVREQRVERLRRLFHLLPASVQRRSGYCERDWRLLSKTLSLSIFDLVRHWLQPFYLRQSLPAAVRERGLREQARPTIEEAETQISRLAQVRREFLAQAKQRRHADARRKKAAAASRARLRRLPRTLAESAVRWLRRQLGRARP